MAIRITKKPEARGLQLYSNAYVFVNGDLLTQESSVTISKKANSRDIKTVHRGWAGQSAGPGSVEVSVESAVPSTDFEFVGGQMVDFWVKSGQLVEIGIVMGSRQTILKGVIQEASFSHSVNEASKVSFTLVGRLELFE